MTWVPEVLNVQIVTIHVLNVNIKITIVLFVPPTELVFQYVHVKMEKLKLIKNVSHVKNLVLPVLVLQLPVLHVWFQDY